MDLQSDFAAMFEDGDDIIISGVTIKGFFAAPGVIEEPFYGSDSGADGTFIIVQKGDLEALGQWPLDEPVVQIAGITYRVIRPHESAGHIQLFLQEA